MTTLHLMPIEGNKLILATPSCYLMSPSKLPMNTQPNTKLINMANTPITRTPRSGSPAEKGLFLTRRYKSDVSGASTKSRPIYNSDTNETSPTIIFRELIDHVLITVSAHMPTIEHDNNAISGAIVRLSIDYSLQAAAFTFG
jgi:hypothetical protein